MLMEMQLLVLAQILVGKLPTNPADPRAKISPTGTRENETDASHCEESVSDAHVQIT